MQLDTICRDELTSQQRFKRAFGSSRKLCLSDYCQHRFWGPTMLELCLTRIACCLEWDILLFFSVATIECNNDPSTTGSVTYRSLTTHHHVIRSNTWTPGSNEMPLHILSISSWQFKLHNTQYSQSLITKGQRARLRYIEEYCTKIFLGGGGEFRATLLKCTRTKVKHAQTGFNRVKLVLAGITFRKWLHYNFILGKATCGTQQPVYL